MRHPRRWLTLAVALAVLVAGVVLALPIAVRSLAVRQLTRLTGRDAVIARAELNLFTRRLAFVQLAIVDTAGRPPLAELERLDCRFRLLALLRGHLHLDDLTLARPLVRVVRTGPEDFNVSGPLAHLLSPQPRTSGLPLVVDRFVLRNGRVVFDDHTAAPPRRFAAEEITADVSHLATDDTAPRGSGTASLTLAGAPLAIRADDITLRPAHGRATVTLTGLDLAPLAAYFPAAGPTLAQGRYTTALTVTWDAGAGVRAEGSSTLAGLVLRLRDGEVITPTVAVHAGDVTYRDGTVAAGHIDISGDPAFVDRSVSPARTHAFSNVHVVVEGARFPAGRPAAARLTGGLPGGGTVAAQGTVNVFPPAADLHVEIADADLAAARPYLPAASPVVLDQGRLGATLALRYARNRLSLDGDFTAADVILVRRGQREPFVTHAALRGEVRGVAFADGGLDLGRLTLAGAPTVVDASVSPPRRFEVASLTLTVRDATWPSRGAAGIEGHGALVGGGTATLEGRFDLARLVGDVRTTFADMDLTRLRPYFPPGSAVGLGHGTASGRFRLQHDPRTGSRIAGDAVMTDLAMTHEGQATPFITVTRLGLALADLVVRDGAVTAGRLDLTGAPRFLDTSVDPPRVFEPRSLRVAVAGATWPERTPARVEVEAELPGAGTLAGRGTIALAGPRVDMALDVADADVAASASFLPVEAPVGGRLDATLQLTATLGDTLRGRLTGSVTARTLSLGPPDRPPLAVERVEASGLDARWPWRLTAERVLIARPSVLVDREKDGSFPLRTMLAARAPRSGSGTASAAGATGTEGSASVGAAAPEIAIGTLAIEDGQARFVDRTMAPSYSEELTRIALTIRGLTSVPGDRADVAVQGIVGGQAALDLHGEVAPFGQPFFLDLAGELRNFALPRTNPYLRRFLDWIARRGQLTTHVHYRITGDALEATNDVVVERLDVERARDAAADRRLGLPLGLIVSLLKDARGEIRLSVPVSGELGSPRFSFGSAIATALRNVVSRLVTAPFRAIGRVFEKNGEVEAVHIDPVRFEAGNAQVTPDAARQLQRVADFLRAAPYVRLVLHPVVSEADVASLKAQEVTAEVQRLQREVGLVDFAAAARRLHRSRHPDVPLPEDTRGILEALAREESVPETAVRDLVSRRLAAALRVLTDEGGIERERLVGGSQAGPAGAPGDPRLEFDLSS